MVTKFDAAVIGAGSFGSWIAYNLARRGYRVALADSHGPGNSRSSSGGETRIIRMSYGANPLYARMARESLGEWKRVFAESGNPGLFIESGALFTAPAGGEFLSASASTLASLDIRHESLGADQLKKRFPQFQFPSATQGIYEPDAGVLLARRAVECVAAAATRLGVTYFNRKAVTTTVRTQIPARRYVFACGPWLPRLFPKQLGRLIFPTRQDVLFFGTPGGDARFRTPLMPAWVDFSNGPYCVPNIENRGLKFGLDTHGPAIDPETSARVMSTATVKRIAAKAVQCFPALAGAPIVETRVCVYENTSSGDFLIDRLAHDVWIAGGGSGHGFKHGPAVGRYVADLLEDRGDPEPRFALASKSAKRQRSVF